ncbi:MAG: STAS/SEC14 domain-containing protein [Candidatus Sumerlaeota bacterium]|nr:STAS/SEC14 domain-containing protein [Candidatus Sumerlaeota bacterium]
MAVQLECKEEGKIIEVSASGKLTAEDYDRLGPEVEQQVKKHGKIRVLFIMSDFHGWTAGALWKDIQFDLKHFADIERLALVGERRWEKGMAAFCKPFTTAKIRYFDHERLDEAKRWVTE